MSGGTKLDYGTNNNNYEIINENATTSTNIPEPPQSKNIVICGRELNMSKGQLLAASMLSTYFFLTWSYFSLFTPFFPGEALKKEQNRSQIGMIFGVLQLVLLILSPFFGKYVS